MFATAAGLFASPVLAVFNQKTSLLLLLFGPSPHMNPLASQRDQSRRFVCLAKDWNPIEKLNFCWRQARRVFLHLLSWKLWCTRRAPFLPL